MNALTATMKALALAGEEALASPAAVAIVLEPDPQVRRLLRRVLPNDGFRLVGDLQIDLASRRVRVRGREVHLTPLEYRLLVALGHHVGQVVPRRQLLLDVWGPMRVQQAHFLRMYMAQLRGNLETDPTHPQYLLTEPGVGYRLSGEPLTGEPDQ